MKRILFGLFSTLLIFNIFSQDMWTNIDLQSVNQESQINARNANYQHLNKNLLMNLLYQAPLKVSKEQWRSIGVDLPMPNGKFQEFMVFEAPIMEASLMSKYPEITTYIIQSTNDLSVYGRADLTPKGFHAMIFSNQGTFFIDPISQESDEYYIIYNKKDFYTSKELPSCAFDELSLEREPETIDHSIIQSNQELALPKNLKLSNGSVLKTYRIAVSATSAYTQFHGGSVTDGLSAIVSTINRVNALYERDFSVRLVLVGNNDQVIFTTTGSDPFYDNGAGDYYDAGDKLGINRTTLNGAIGQNNYDIGHVVGRSGSGLAGFGVVCSNSNFQHKASGTTGISNPIGDPFDVDYVAHEIGHQFRGSHTFNGSAGSCATNISTNSAYEPGSGTTIMAYAGICSPQNTQNNSDDHFHNRTFNQVVNFITSGNGDNCPVESTTGNAIPTVQIITNTNLTIPISTPFELEALAQDNDGDPLTYCWEQYDLGPQGDPLSPSGNAPLFRSFSPTINPIRTFPQISDIVNNTETYGEMLPSYSRDMNFRVTVRDNVAGGGAAIDEEISVSVTASAGPFLVTNPNTSVSWTAGDTEMITWDVANTNNAPVNCSNVDVLLSTDGGLTFPIVLLSNVPNNGNATITVPFALSNMARIKIVCSSNIFFDVSNEDFAIVANCNGVDASIEVVEEIGDAIFCLNSLGQLSLVANSPQLAITTYTWFHNNIQIPNSNNSTLTINNVQNSDAGDYYCSISNGCNTVLSNTGNVSVTTNPIVPMVTQSGNQLQSSLSNGNQWYFNGVLLPGETSQFITISQEGTYTAKSVAGACSAFSDPFVTAIKNLNDIADMQILPNPSNGVFYVSVNNYNQEVNIIVTDVLGQIVMNEFDFNNFAKLDLTGFSTGMYLVKLCSKNYSASYKLVKK